MPDNKIKRGQVYESCRPTFVIDGVETRTRIKVVGYANRRKVQVATLTDGRELRRRWLEATQLHRDDKPRRTGYRLVGDSGDGDD